MNFEEQLKNDYFEWMYQLMCGQRFPQNITYRKLFTILHEKEFTYFVPYDENRAAKGMSLRYHYCLLHECERFEYCLDGPCSILEMMVALAIECEHIMRDTNIGDRTSQWFWEMIRSLGLSSMTDYNFDDRYVDDVIWKFLNRKYNPNGKGSLFTVPGWRRDARDAEIWHQAMAYLNTLG